MISGSCLSGYLRFLNQQPRSSTTALGNTPETIALISRFLSLAFFLFCLEGTPQIPSGEPQRG